MGRVTRALILVSIIAGLLLVGCEEGGQQHAADVERSPTPTQTRTPRAGFSPNLEPTAEYAELSLHLTAIAADSEAIAARNAAATTQARVEIADREATRAWGAATAQAQATADEIARRVEGTRQAQAAQATQQAIDTEGTRQALASEATAQAMSQNATATAVSANTTSTAVAAEYTRQAVDSYATGTAVAVVQEIEAAILERERLDLQRDRAWQGLKTVVPWLLLVLFLVAVGWVGYNYVVAWQRRQKVIKRDGRGDAPLYLADGQSGGVRIVDVDRSPGPVTVVDGDVIAVPEIASPAVQERTVARDQEVDRQTRGLPGQVQQQKRQKKALPAQAGRGSQPINGPRIKVVEPVGQLLGWLKGVAPKMLSDGEEANGER